MAGVLVGTVDGLHEFMRAGVTHRISLPGEEVGALARDGDSWWAITGGAAIWSGDSNGRWESAAHLEGIRANCLCWSSTRILVGTSEAHLMSLGRHGLEPVESFEKVEGRDAWYTPWGGPPDVRSLSRGPDGVIHANVHVGGIVRSTDDGVSWHPTIDIHADVHQVLVPASPAGLVVAATARGLAGSDDGGDTWLFDTEGLHASYARAVAVGDSVVYLSASLGPRGGRAALYRIALTGGPFEKCSDGLPEWFADNVDTGCVAAAGDVVAFGMEDGSLFVSEDSGRTWESWASGLPAVRCVALF